MALKQIEKSDYFINEEKHFVNCKGCGNPALKKHLTDGFCLTCQKYDSEKFKEKINAKI